MRSSKAVVIFASPNTCTHSPMRFELAKKEVALNMRLPAALMDAVRAKAKAQGLPVRRYVRMVLEADLRRGR